MFRARLVVALTAGALVSAWSALPAHAAVSPVSAPTVAQWRMDEPAGATVMRDSSGNSHDVDVASWTGRAAGGFFDWADDVKPNLSDPAGHNVTVPHAADLNPDRATFVVEFDYRNHRPYGNVAQKGQAGAGARGGYWKFQAPQGEISVLFRGPDGSNAVRYQDDRDYDGDGVAEGRLDDGAWHSVRGERGFDARGEFARLWVDGMLIGTNRGSTGSIVNAEPVYIGGKGFCDQTTITCDLFSGELRSLVIGKG